MSKSKNMERKKLICERCKIGVEFGAAYGIVFVNKECMNVCNTCYELLSSETEKSGEKVKI